MLYDEALRNVGDFGRYQWFIALCCALATTSNAMGVYGYVFVTIVTDLWCKNSTTGTEDMNSDVRNEHCDMTTRAKGSLGAAEVSSFSNNTANSSIAHCYNGWTDGGATIIMEWDLVCERSYMAGLTQTVFLAGMMVGVMTSGIAADRFGRFKTIVVIQVVLATSSIAVGFSYDVITFSVLRFFQGAAGLSAESTLLILVMEIVTPEWRVFANTMRYMCWMLGVLLTVGAAYAFRQWRTLYLVIGTPTIIHVIVLPFILESPRWLHAKGNKHQAEVVLYKIARRNGNPDAIVDLDKHGDETDGSGTESWLKVLCNYPKLFGRLVLMTLIWVAVVLSYFGLTFTSVMLGNRFVNFTICGAIELPIYLFLWVGLDRFGRRVMTGAPIVISGIVLLLILAVPSDPDISWVLILLSHLGKAGVTLAYAVVYPFTAELFPTMLRNTAVSFASSCSRLGSLVAPQLALMASYNKHTPLAVFGVLSLVAGGLTFMLPETAGKTLPETLRDGENMTWRKTKKNKSKEECEIGDNKECTHSLTNETLEC